MAIVLLVQMFLDNAWRTAGESYSTPPVDDSTLYPTTTLYPSTTLYPEG